MFGFLQMEPGMKAHFSESQSGINGDYFINGYSAELLPGNVILWTPVLKDDPGYYLFWKLDQGQLDTSTGIYNTVLG